MKPLSADIAARMAVTVGDGPRIEPLGHHELSEEMRVLTGNVRASAGADAVEIEPEYMRTMARHPAIFRCHMEMGTAIFRGLLLARERELAVLRIGWLCGAPYEWGEHVDIAHRAGISGDEIERVTAGSSAPGWNVHDAAILRGVEELLADKVLSDSTWAALAATWDEPRLIEYVMMVGQYVATAFVQNSLRVRLMSDNPGLSHR